MSKFPNNITINKPIPSHLGLKGSILLKKSDANRDHRYRNEPANEPIEYINNKNDLIDLRLRLLIKKPYPKFK